MYLYVLFLIAPVLLGWFELVAQDKPSSDVRIIAHRGDWRNYPENSLLGIESCISHGIEIAEIDVRKTLDGEFVVFHDEVLDFDTDGKGYIRELTLDSIRKVYLKEGYGRMTRQKIPTLEEVLQLSKERIELSIDKAWEEIPAIYQILKKYGMTDQVYFGSSKPYADVRQEIGLYLDSIQFKPFVMTSLQDRIGFVEEYLDNTTAVQDVFVLVDDEPDRTESLIRFLQARDLQITLSSCFARGSAGHDDELSISHPEDGWGWLIDFGADLIFTDRPLHLQQYLNNITTTN
ncbi:MAG: glycerophosphodiester phosphodiesterase family protein [Bacteroidota bacterium]